MWNRKRQAKLISLQTTALGFILSEQNMLAISIAAAFIDNFFIFVLVYIWLLEEHEHTLD